MKRIKAPRVKTSITAGAKTTLRPRPAPLYAIRPAPQPLYAIAIVSLPDDH